MNKKEKKIVVRELADRLSQGSTIYLTDISNLNSKQTHELRLACFKAKVSLSVIKNTFLEKAMEVSDKEFGDLPTVLKGNTSIMFAEGSSIPAKLIKAFRKTSKLDRPVFKGAYVEESIFLGEGALETLSNMKSKEEIIGDIIVLLQSPMKNVISSLQSGQDALAGIIKTLSER